MSRTVEIASDVLGRLPADAEGARTIEYCVEALLYRESWGEEVSGLSKESMESVLKNHLRQSGALTSAERAELSAA